MIGLTRTEIESIAIANGYRPIMKSIKTPETTAEGGDLADDDFEDGEECEECECEPITPHDIAFMALCKQDWQDGLITTDEYREIVHGLPPKTE